MTYCLNSELCVWCLAHTSKGHQVMQQKVGKSENHEKATVVATLVLVLVLVY